MHRTTKTYDVVLGIGMGMAMAKGEEDAWLLEHGASRIEHRCVLRQDTDECVPLGSFSKVV
jgi:hypothetical protein